jgi:hypothetical protein
MPTSTSIDGQNKDPKDLEYEDDPQNIRHVSYKSGESEDHVTVAHEGRHRSWDVDDEGNVTGDHSTDHSTKEKTNHPDSNIDEED